MTKKAATKQIKQNGQSMVEVALFLPVLVILLAGIVELSQLVITQNRVSNAARVAARFGANGGEDDGMAVVALNAITQTLEARPDRWDIWAIHGQVNDTGSNIGEFTFEHTYGISNTQLFSTVLASNIQDDIWAELQIDETAGTATPAELADLRFVGTYILHDVDSILGLDAFPALANFSSVRALTVMRVTGLNLEPTIGCNAFPIGVDEITIRSVTAPGTGSSPYPNTSPSEFTYPVAPPEYTSFVNHQASQPIRDSREGYLFKFETTTFHWLRWNTSLPNDATTLIHSLDWPGDSTTPTYSFSEPGDPTDESLNISDWVAVNTGSTTSSVNDILEEHVDRERTLRVILYDDEVGNTVQISGFAVFRIIGFNTSQDWLIAEFIRLDESCGQEIQTTP